MMLGKLREVGNTCDGSAVALEKYVREHFLAFAVRGWVLRPDVINGLGKDVKVQLPVRKKGTAIA